MDSIASTLRAMLSQEEAYSCYDYILRDSHNVNDKGWLMWRSSLLNREDLEMNRDFRTTMVGWAYQVTDYVKFQRETVEFAVSYFDRYLQTQQAQQQSKILQDRGEFQLAFISCLYLATKLHEPTPMSKTFFSILSKGKYTMPQITKMESTILSALQWRMNPPTALAFVRHFIALHPLTRIISPSMRDTIYDLSKVQVELMVDDYRFVTVPKSTIALAALSNSLESLQIVPAAGVPDSSCGRGFGMAHLIAMATENVEQVTQVRTALYQVISKLPHIATSFLPKTLILTSSSCRGSLADAKRASSHQESPRTVYHHHHQDQDQFEDQIEYYDDFYYDTDEEEEDDDDSMEVFC